LLGAGNSTLKIDIIKSSEGPDLSSFSAINHFRKALFNFTLLPPTGGRSISVSIGLRWYNTRELAEEFQVSENFIRKRLKFKESFS